MNSTDRSIALVDFALRRRFAFREVEPNLEVLRKWYEKNPPKVESERIIDLLKRINDRISQDERLGKNFQIGHSYFMKTGLDLEKLQRIWDQHILPLLEEYYPGQPEELTTYRDLFSRIVGELRPQ